MPINHQLRDSASPVELAAHAKPVEAGCGPFSVLAINGASSSFRFTLFKAGESLAQILAGKFERIGLPDAGLSFTDVLANQSDERRIDAPTPFDLVVMNDLDRFHLVADVIDRVPALGPRAAYAKQAIRDKLIEHKQYIVKHGEDLPEIRNWQWGAKK